MNSNYLLCSAALGVALCLAGCGQVEEEDSAEQSPVPVEVYAVRTGEFTEILPFAGDVRGRSQVEVYPKVSGKLKNYAVREGGMVERNQPLAFIERDVTGHDFAPAPVESPIPGLVARLYPDEGDYVSQQTPLAVVADTSEVIIRFSVAERDYPAVQKGQRARVTIDAYPGREFAGEVTRLSGLIDPGSRTAAAEVSVPNPDALLVPGMFARMELATGTREALLAPRDGVVRRPGTASRYSYVVEDGAVRRRRVSTGASMGEYFEIISGLEEGDRIVVSGHGILEDGMPVKIAGGAE